MSVKKRWRLEVMPSPNIAGGGGVIRWGPWRTAVEVHQAYVSATTSAVALTRTVSLRQRQAPSGGLTLMEVACQGFTANTANARITWGQGFASTNQALTAAGDERIITTFLPFAFIVNVGELVEMQIWNNDTGDFLINPVLMVRDLDDTERGR